MREDREHIYATYVGPGMDQLRLLSAQIMATLGDGDVEVLQFGSCVYRADIAKSDVDCVIVLGETCPCSIKEFLTHLIAIMKSDEAKEVGWTRVTGVKTAHQRKMIQPRFRGVEFDVAVCYIDSSNHPQSVLSEQLRDALSVQERAKGDSFL